MSPIAKFLTLLVVVCAFATGCFSTSHGFKSPYAKRDLRAGFLAVNNAADLKAALIARTPLRDNLWARSEVVVRQDAVRGSRYFSAVLLYREPDQIRLRGSRMEIGNIFDVLVLGDQASVFLNRSGDLYRGSLAQLAETSGRMAGFGPRDFLGALMVQQELRRALEGSDPVGVLPKGDAHLLVATKNVETGRQFFWLVRKADGLVEERLVRNAQGAEELRILYRRYSLEGPPGADKTEPFPQQMTLQVAASGATVALDLDSYRLDYLFPTQAFIEPRADKVFPLRDLGNAEAP